MRSCKGATVVEFSLLLPLYLLLIFAIIDFGLLFWANLTMQFAVREGARYAVTGQVNLDPNTTHQQRYLAVIDKMQDSSIGLWGIVNPTIEVSINGGPFQVYGAPKTYTPGMFGNPTDIVALRLDCGWPLLTSISKHFTDRKYIFSVAATMRNEAY